MNISQLFQAPFSRNLHFDKAQQQLKKLGSFGKFFSKPNNQTGKVYLVGAGPGDSELLTMKAYRLLQQVDVVLYDWLVSGDIINMIPAKVKTEFVGKKCGRHSMTQADICQLMSDYALQGKNVVRLKGGDPAIFGRAAEEIEHLKQHNIKFAIVPGVTASSGCSAWSGIPLTHRDCAHSVRFITAHFKSDDIQSDWQNFANSEDTLVFYMGLSKIASIAENLIKHGKDKTTPIALVDQGTTSQSKTYVSTLAEIEEQLIHFQLQGPALVIVGTAIEHRANVDISLLAKDALLNQVEA